MSWKSGFSPSLIENCRMVINNCGQYEWAGPDRVAAVPDEEAEPRLARIEGEMAELREQVMIARSDAAAARVLASGADRDVSEVRAELRAHTQSLNALRETQLEQGHAISELRQEMETGFADVRREMDDVRQEMRNGFSMMATGMAQITALLTEAEKSERDEG